MSPKGSRNHLKKKRGEQKRKILSKRQIAENNGFQVHAGRSLNLFDLKWWIKGDPPRHMTRVFVVELKEPMFDREIRDRLHVGFGDLNGHKKQN